MPANALIPTIETVQRIIAIDDPVIRNLQITHCYHELSAALARRTGLSANWCTFATWASKQAGQTIRKEDLARALERPLEQPLSSAAGENGSPRGVEAAASPQERELRRRTITLATERASEAVGRGNKKVFEEIGLQFARFYSLCLDGLALENESINRFCEGLKPGDPPDGQEYLRRAFTHYFEALGETDGKTRAELILLANIQIGFHEQTRLQPEIGESLNAGLISFLELMRPLSAGLFPMGSWPRLANLYFRRMLGRPTALDRAVQAQVAEVQSRLRQFITESMMTITLPSGAALRLGHDLASSFPESLRRITNSELSLFLKQYDPSQDSPVSSGAIDWADLSDRLHFILDLFRCYQEDPGLFEPPFKPEQVEAFTKGRRPAGRL